MYTPEPTSAVPGPILRLNRDSHEYREVRNDGLRPSPVSGRDNGRDGWSGGYNGGFAGRSTDQTIRPVVDYRIPYEGT